MCNLINYLLFANITIFKLCNISMGVSIWSLNSNSKKCSKNIPYAKYMPHTSPIFTNLNVSKINYIRLLQQLKLYYKLIHNTLPESFYLFSTMINYEIHNHYTRNRNRMVTVRTKHEFAKRCIRYYIFQVINNIPISIQNKLRNTHSKRI